MKNPVTKIKKQRRERRCCFSDSLAPGIVKKRGRKNTLPNALMMNGFVSVGCRKKGEKTHLN